MPEVRTGVDKLSLRWATSALDGRKLIVGVEGRDMGAFRESCGGTLGDGKEWTVRLAGALMSIFKDGVEARAIPAEEDGDLDKVSGIVGIPLDGVSFAAVVGTEGGKIG